MVKDEVNFESYMTNELQRVKRDMSVYYTTIFKMKKHETNVQKAIGILKAANIKFPVPTRSLGNPDGQQRVFEVHGIVSQI